MIKKKQSTRNEDPQWYKDALIYELHVRAFCDSNGDGIGDFRGLTSKLDYLQELGVTAIWLLPFFPSPQRDDGYDIADYMDVHPSFGTLADFKKFLAAAHSRGIKVIIELVINHTSSEHEWFKLAQRSKPGSNARDFYVWSKTPDKYQDARIIFQDFEMSNWTWDPVAESYYWHRFYSHQPDLNFDNPSVHKAIFRVADFWYSMGVDGMRLDAVPYLYEREDTNCENLPVTHAFLKKLRAHVDRKFQNRMFLAEANQWPEDSAAYFGDGDECQMCFHFPLMPRMFMAVEMEDNYPIIDILRTTPVIPPTCQWATFLRNHDELTLEMVTDEERDYMHRVYARDPKMKINLGIRRRLAPLLGNNRRKIELLNILLFSAPGTPVIYYGDELGMGDNFYLGDRDGVRTPMQWSPDRNAGFSKANPQQLYLPVIGDPEYHHEAINVETEELNQSSLLWWMKRLIAVRRRFRAFGRGEMQFIYSENSKVLSFIRTYGDEVVLVAANLSQFSQMAALDLSSFAGYVPEEIFSSNEFPPIGKKEYVLTFVPYAYYWFVLRKKETMLRAYEKDGLPNITLQEGLGELLTGTPLEDLESDILPSYLPTCRWFAAKTRKIRRLVVEDTIDLTAGDVFRMLLVLKIEYSQGRDEMYLLPVSYAPEQAGHAVSEEVPFSIIARITVGSTEGVLYDSTADTAFHEDILRMVLKARRIKGRKGLLSGVRGKKLPWAYSKDAVLPSRLMKVEQSNSSILFGQSFFFKLYRKLDFGTNPELDMIRYLTDSARCSYTPKFAGALEYAVEGQQPVTVGMMQDYVENSGDAWTYALEEARRFYQKVLSGSRKIPEPDTLPLLFSGNGERFDLGLSELIGETFLHMMEQLGCRTADLHLALGRGSQKDFAPEPSGLLYQRSLYQSMQAQLNRTVETLTRCLAKLPADARADAREVLSSQKKIAARLSKITLKSLGGKKIRIHGDYHLGQVLRTGGEFTIIDFEGEPARSVGERKLKYSPLKDVAGMVRSFHYAAYGAFLLDGRFREEDAEILAGWAFPWYAYTARSFLRGYLDTMGDSPLIPRRSEDLAVLLDAFLIDKSIYEINYEINNRPDWVTIPFKSILNTLKYE